MYLVVGLGLKIHPPPQVLEARVVEGCFPNSIFHGATMPFMFLPCRSSDDGSCPASILL